NKNADYRITANVKVEGNPDFVPEHLSSYDLGYSGEYLDKHLHADLSLFYMEISHVEQQYTKSVVGPLVTTSYNNTNHAIARGAEASLRYRFDQKKSVYANYTYERITDILAKVGVTDSTPRHKLNLGGWAMLQNGISLSSNIGYKVAHTAYASSANRQQAIPAYWRIDARLAYRLCKNAEIFAAGQNLAQERHIEFPDAMAVPRTYQAGISVSFGN
ncbi:MAG: TonB-dependent receptor, partial [Elusimicrobiota bacterium]